MDFQLDLNSELVKHAHPVEPLCVEPQTPVSQVLDKMRDARRGAVLICEDGKLTGIFTERDALKLTAGGADASQPISAVMISSPVSLQEKATVGQAVSKMSFGGYRHLPIVDENDKPVGMLQVSGILHYLVEHFPGTIYNLPPNPHHSPQQREGA